LRIVVQCKLRLILFTIPLIYKKCT
jgi:hypothetical protein